LVSATQPSEQIQHGNILAFAIPTVIQCLAVAGRHHGVHFIAEQVTKDFELGPDEPDSGTLHSIADQLGLELGHIGLSEVDFARVGPALPAILPLKNGNAMLLLSIDETAEGPTAKLYDPAVGEATPLTTDLERLLAAASGELILVRSTGKNNREAPTPFGVGSLFQEVVREKRLFRDIVLAAGMMSVLALAPAIFWQLVVDRVLVYKSLSTLNVLVGGMALLILFETMFGFLRRTLILVATARIDARLSSFVFSKLLNIGIEFFEKTATGVVTRDVNEVWRIRNFLTGQMFGTMLDAIVLLVVLPVLFWFSPLLASIVLMLGVLMVAVIMGFLPFIRRRASRAFHAEGRQNAYLIESVQGIRTVKSLAVERQRRRAWDRNVADAARLRREAGGLVNVVQTIVTPLEKMMTSGVIAIAAYMAVTTDNPMMVGTLIAFGILSQRVAQPLIQLAYLVQQFDEASRAVRTVAAVVNHPPEEGRGVGGLCTPIQGSVEFSGIRFRDPGASSLALNEVSFKVAASSIFGIMGRSGSGKTTITRLLQGLHRSYDGLIRVDGTDIRAIDLDHLRRSTGVVLQDSFLFSGSIRDNIAASAPGASFEQIVAAARLAGAEEFIERLPRGYDTMIEEGGANLSGGQRQRLAIARALLPNPSLLIFDEATSALDPESEAIINANLKRIAKNRTVIVISHRLSSLVPSDAILALDNGRVVDVGKHEQLLKRCDLYRKLWRQQNFHSDLSVVIGAAQ
jgi:ATP-binding cassette subfamily B protein